MECQQPDPAASAWDLMWISHLGLVSLTMFIDRTNKPAGIARVTLPSIILLGSQLSTELFIGRVLSTKLAMSDPEPQHATITTKRKQQNTKICKNLARHNRSSSYAQTAAISWGVRDGVPPRCQAASPSAGFILDVGLITAFLGCLTRTGDAARPTHPASQHPSQLLVTHHWAARTDRYRRLGAGP